MSNKNTTPNLPELPVSYGDHCVTDSVRTMREPGYTAYQMHAYAADAVRAANARAESPLATALLKIADRVHEGPRAGCGCSFPCRCETPESIAIWKEEIREEIEDAIDAAQAVRSEGDTDGR